MSHSNERDGDRDDLAPRVSLSSIDVDEIAAQRIRSRALDALAGGGRRRRPGSAGRYVEATIVVGVAASYLIWAISTVFVMYP